jgi:Domain of unknown function (DUF4406)
MKVYLSGPMTGYPELNFQAFHELARHLRGHGDEVINPAEINDDQHADWTECIIEDIKQLSKCEAIYMMRGWGDSYGAQIEYLVAKKLGLKVEFESDYDF